MADDFRYDVFLSHSAKDKVVVRALAERLRADNLRVWFDEWALKPGDNIPAKIEEGLEHSRALVLCMSAHAFGSDWAHLESYTFRFRDPLNKERRFIPLRLDTAPIKGSLAQFLYINWLTDEREQEYGKLLEACHKGEMLVLGDMREKNSRPLSPPIKLVEPLTLSDPWPTDLTLPEQVHLICADAETGNTRCSYVAYHAAALGELVLAQRVKLELEEHAADRFSVWASILDSSPIRDLILDAAITTLVKWTSRSRRIDIADYRRLGKLFGPSNDDVVVRQLVNKGILGEKREKLLFVFSSTKYPVLATAKQMELRDKLYAAVMAHDPLNDRIAIILACASIAPAYPIGLRESQKMTASELAEAKLQTNGLGTLLSRMIANWEWVNAQPMTAS